MRVEAEGRGERTLSDPPAPGRARKAAREVTVATADGMVLLLRQRSPGSVFYDVYRRRKDNGEEQRIGGIEKMVMRTKKWRSVTRNGSELGDTHGMYDAALLVVEWYRGKVEAKKTRQAQETEAA